MKKIVDECICENTSKNGKVISYTVEVKVGKGKRKSVIKTFKTADYKNKEVALKKAQLFRDNTRDKKDEIAREMKETKNNEMYVISSIFESSIELGNHSEGTNTDHRKVYNKHIKPYGEMDIRDITVADIQKTIHNAMPNNKKSSLDRILTIWRSIYRTANNLGLRVEDITPNVKIKVREEVDENPDDYAIINDDDLEFFLETLNQYGQHTEAKDYERKCFYYMVKVGRATGLRPSELTALSKQCITLHEDQGYAEIHVWKAVGSTANKKITLVTTKNKYSKRYVYVSGKDYELLKEAMDFTKYDLLFVKYDGSLMNSTFASNHINNVNDKCKTLGRDFKFSLYGLRKTFASDMAKKVSPQILMRMMGHSNIETTYKYYVKVDQQSIKDAFLINNI